MSSFTNQEGFSPTGSLGSLLDQEPMEGLKPARGDVDDLLDALEREANHDSFAAQQDNDSFVQDMLESELEPIPRAVTEAAAQHGSTSTEMDKLDLNLENHGSFTENSLSGLPLGVDPLPIEDMSSDPNLSNLDQKFMQNSIKFDEFISHRAGSHIANSGGASQNAMMTESTSSTTMAGGGAVGQPVPLRATTVREEPTPIAHATAGGYDSDDPTSCAEDVEVQNYPGKRRKAQRRGSLPTMHLNYDPPEKPLQPQQQLEEDPFAPTPIGENANLPPHQTTIPPPQQTTIPTPPPTEETYSTYTQPLGGSGGSGLSRHPHRHQMRSSSSVDMDVVQPEKKRRAQRRGSLPSMHLNYSADDAAAPDMTSIPTQLQALSITSPSSTPKMQPQSSPSPFGGFGGSTTTASSQKPQQKIVFEFQIPKPDRMQRRGSTGGSAHFSFRPEKTQSSIPENERDVHSDDGCGAITLGRSDSSDSIPSSLDPKAMMDRLKALMKKSAQTQKALQQWDKKNGLPKSHSQTMVNSSRSRKQLQDGVILPKWDGTPLINGETELGKPKPRTKKQATEEDVGGGGGKAQRRMSAPASSGYFM